MYNAKTNTFTHKYIEIKRSLKYKENNSLKISEEVMRSRKTKKTKQCPNEIGTTIQSYD